MDSLKQWALCLLIGAFAGTFVMVISPRGSMDKTVRAITGVFIVAIISMPFVNLLKSSYSTEVYAAYGYADSGEDMRDYMLNSFLESVKKELESSASLIGVPLEKIHIDAETDSENCIIIHKISVAINAEFSEKTEELSYVLKKNTGAYIEIIAE